jgi:predicted secreted protein
MRRHCRFDDLAPTLAMLTPYDDAHLVDYLRLLDADSEGADWREVCVLLFELDPAVEPERAERMHASHLARARWMTQVGYAHLLGRQDELRH